MIYKRCQRCNARILSGTTCECRKQFQRQSAHVYDKYQRNKRSDTFYHSKEWEVTRDTVLALDNHIDVYLWMTERKVVPADAVHHIYELDNHWDRRCDIDNLISLSTATHALIENMYKTNKSETQEKLIRIVKEYREGV